MKLSLKKHKLVSILSILAILFTFHPTMSFAATSLNDISDHWAKDQIESWVNSNYIKGYPDGTFKPDNNITRAEFMTLVNNAYGFTEKATTSYTDVADGSWYADAVAAAKAAGYIAGYPDDTMKPNNPITRQEAAVIVARIDSLTADETSADQFTDASSIPAWSKGAIGAGVKANIFTGYPDDSFKGYNLILRGESIVALSKAKAYMDAPALPVSVTMSITDISSTGFQLNLSPAVDSLTQENVTLTQGDTAITVGAITTNTSGAAYSISAALEGGQTYKFSIAKDGYSFGEDSFIVVPTAEAAADAVNAQIIALPPVDQLTLADTDAVKAAQAGFDALTSEQVSSISTENVEKLNNAVAKIGELKAAADQAAANIVLGKIAGLPNTTDLTIADEVVVNEAKDAYDTLTADQKNLVDSDNQTKLNDAIAKMNDLLLAANQPNTNQ